MKYPLIILGVLVAIPLTAYVAGLFIPEGHSASVTRYFNAPADRVWQAVTDVRRYEEWRSNVEQIVVPSDTTQNLRWREVYTDDYPMAFEEVERVDGTRFVVRIADENLPFGGTWTYGLDQTESGVRLTITEDGEIYNPLFRFVSKFIMGYTTTIDRFLSDLEQLLNDGSS